MIISNNFDPPSTRSIESFRGNRTNSKKHLSMNFSILNLLAFFMHQIFELSDGLYQQCRKAFGSKRNLWDHLRVAIRLLIFPDWQMLLMRVLRPSEFL